MKNEKWKSEIEPRMKGKNIKKEVEKEKEKKKKKKKEKWEECQTYLDQQGKLYFYLFLLGVDCVALWAPKGCR